VIGALTGQHAPRRRAATASIPPARPEQLVSLLAGLAAHLAGT